MNQSVCRQCGKCIANKRTDAVYCSDRCRMRSKRASEAQGLLSELIQLCSCIPNHLLQNSMGARGIRMLNEMTGKMEVIDGSELVL